MRMTGEFINQQTSWAESIDDNDTHTHTHNKFYRDEIKLCEIYNMHSYHSTSRKETSS